MSEMSREKALEVLKILRFGTFEEIINTQEIVNEALDMAIDALNGEKICPVYSDGEVKQPCVNCLECDAEIPHSEWIPCTERLPENNDKCIVWCEWIDEEGYECGEHNVASCYNGHWYGKCLQYKVKAWMPLPEPYKEEGGESE